MKKILFLTVVALWSLSAGAQPFGKETLVYSVKGSDTLRLDRYKAAVPEGEVHPCLLFVFGGGFTSGQRDDAAYLPFFSYMTARGNEVVSIDYRLGMKQAGAEALASPELFMGLLLKTLYMATEDLYTATACVLTHAGPWGIDPARIVACGSSAGAITVLQGEYGICNGEALATGILPQGFNSAGVISFAGAIFDMGEDLVWKSAPSPLMLFHGDGDSNVPYDALRMGGAGFFGSHYIARQLARLQHPYYFHSAENAAHELASDPMNENRYEIDDFLEKLVDQRRPLMIDTRVVQIGKPGLEKNPTIEDFIRTNYGQ